MWKIPPTGFGPDVQVRSTLAGVGSFRLVTVGTGLNQTGDRPQIGVAAKSSTTKGE